MKPNWKSEGNLPGYGELNLSDDELTGLEQDGVI